jgi:hypothetical protein
MPAIDTEVLLRAVTCVENATDPNPTSLIAQCPVELWALDALSAASRGDTATAVRLLDMYEMAAWDSDYGEPGPYRCEYEGA